MGCGPSIPELLPVLKAGRSVPMETNATALPFASTMGEPDCPASVAPVASESPQSAKGLHLTALWALTFYWFAHAFPDL